MRPVQLHFVYLMASRIWPLLTGLLQLSIPFNFDESNLSSSHTKYHRIIIMTFTTANEKLYIGQINLFKVYKSSFNLPLSKPPKRLIIDTLIFFARLCLVSKKQQQ